MMRQRLHTITVGHGEQSRHMLLDDAREEALEELKAAEEAADEPIRLYQESEARVRHAQDNLNDMRTTLTAATRRVEEARKALAYVCSINTFNT